MKKNPNSIYIVPDILEQIFVLLPLNSILKFKCVSKGWRSILEAKTFAESRMSLQKSQKSLLVAHYCDCGGRPSLLHILPPWSLKQACQIVYLHCENTAPTTLHCDGLLCFLESKWINVLNPSTGQLRRFPSIVRPLFMWSLGFGKDNVTKRFKIVVSIEKECNVIDVETGECNKLSLPSYAFDLGRNPVCVNGCMYWLYLACSYYNILGLDLHKEKFRNISVPAKEVTWKTNLVNLENVLTIVTMMVEPDWRLEISSMNVEEEKWSKIYSINLNYLSYEIYESGLFTLFTPVMIPKLGDLLFYDNFKRLYKYDGETDEIHSWNICVISPYLENLISLGSDLGNNLDYKIRTCTKHRKRGSGIFQLLRRIKRGTTVLHVHVLLF